MNVILTCNAGSTNVKLAAYDRNTLERKAKAVIRNSQEEIAAWIASVGADKIAAVGHRVVHGGNLFKAPARITSEVIQSLGKLSPLAPLHQPPALEIIAKTQRLFPGTMQVACFDTAFHQTLPPVERRLPLPRTLHDEGIMRYGFHGISYQHIADILPKAVGDRARGRIVVAHLGGGSSACAMKELTSVAVTMSFSTLDGLMMGTRCGALDAGVVLHLLQEKRLSAGDVANILYRQSGLKGVSGISGDMRELLESPSPEAKEAVELYCHLAARQIAGLLTALGGLDLLVFTGGIGENAASVREKIAALLSWVGHFETLALPADEEIVIARACAELIEVKPAL